MVLDWVLAEAKLDELFVTAGEPHTDELNGDELKFRLQVDVLLSSFLASKMVLDWMLV